MATQRPAPRTWADAVLVSRRWSTGTLTAVTRIQTHAHTGTVAG
jgi:hypothetical protein